MNKICLCGEKMRKVGEWGNHYEPTEYEFICPECGIGYFWVQSALGYQDMWINDEDEEIYPSSYYEAIDNS